MKSRDRTVAREMILRRLSINSLIDHPRVLRRFGIVIECRRDGNRCSFRRKCVIVAERAEEVENENEQYRAFFKDHVLMNAANKAELITRLELSRNNSTCAP